MKRRIVKAGATSLESLVMEDVAMPEPGSGEVRVKVHAVSLNARDQLLVSGAFGVAGADFIAISDGAGEIDALGPDVDGWSVGERSPASTIRAGWMALRPRVRAGGWAPRGRTACWPNTCCYAPNA